MQSWIFRFVSILGERYARTCLRLLYAVASTPECSRIRQRQAAIYLHVTDCVDAILLALEGRRQGNIFNLGTDEYCTVDESIGWITGFLGLNPARHYAGGDRGWVGDSPFIFLTARGPCIG